MTDMGYEPLSDHYRTVAADLADLLLTIGAAAEDPVIRPRLIDAALAAIPAGTDRLRVLWHAQQGLLTAAIAADQGVPEDLLAAEARQRLAVGDLATVGLAAAEKAEADRIRAAAESGWCTEYQCRHRPTNCAETCCWHCGRPNHRMAFSAAQTAADE